MSAMEKVYWAELVITLLVCALVASAYPWLGDGATGIFALLALIAVFGAWFLRRKKNQILVDERDRAIDQRAIRWGIGAGWGLFLGTLVILVLSSGMLEYQSVSVRFLNWLVWIQFAICEGVKGLAGVCLYRNQRHGA